MERCHGKTKAGARCKRTASGDSRFCSMHADQAEKATADRPAGGESAGAARERDPLDTIVAATALGVVVFAVLTLRRLFRFL